MSRDTSSTNLNVTIFKKENIVMFCEICKVEIKFEGGVFSRWHLDRVHNIESKTYYDTYLKTDENSKCKTCKKETTFLSFGRGYQDFCSQKCLSNNSEIKDKRQKTNLKLYGFSNPLQNSEVKTKTLTTLKEKYNVENISQIENVKLKKIKTCLKNHGVSNPLQDKGIKNKAIKTLIQNYGVSNPSKSDVLQNKKKQTSLERYGTEFYAQSQICRTFNELSGNWIPLSDKTDYEIYCLKVWKVTNKFIAELFKNWDGKCYYSQEDLDTNPKNYNEANYATIDHKISIFYGFKNKIDAEIIGNINNLCICSRIINSKKGSKTEKQFKK